MYNLKNQNHFQHVFLVNICRNLYSYSKNFSNFLPDSSDGFVQMKYPGKLQENAAAVHVYSANNQTLSDPIRHKTKSKR